MTNDEIIELFHSEKTLTELRKEIGMRVNTISDLWKAHYGDVAYNERKRIRYRRSKLADNNPMKGKYRENSPKYIHGNRISDSSGRPRVRAPEWYEGAAHDGYVFEHTLVYCGSRGLTKIPEGHDVHHLDMDKQNNDPSNLILLTHSDHSLLHKWITKFEAAIVQRLSGNGVEN